MKDKLTLDDIAEFTWLFSQRFFLETAKGNFVWNDPRYEGDNTITRVNQTYEEFTQGNVGRDKGKKIIRDYVGDDAVIVDSK